MVSVLEVSYVMLPYVTNMLKCIGQKLCLGWPFSASNFEFNNLSVLLQFKVPHNLTGVEFGCILNLINLMKSYQYILSDRMWGKYH